MTMRPLSGSRFAVTVGWRIVAFTALSLAGPWIARIVQDATSCTGTEGACVAISVATGTLLRPLILLLLALALMRPCWRRMRTLGSWGGAGLLIPILLLLDWRMLTAFGPTYIPVSFGLGVLNSGFPFFTALALTMLVLLIVSRAPSAPGDTLWRRHGVVGVLGWLASLVAILAGVAATALYLAWLSSIATAGIGSPLFSQAVQAGRLGNIASLIAIVPFIWMIIAELFHRPAASERGAPA
jgi:hypothetical protein